MKKTDKGSCWRRMWDRLPGLHRKAREGSAMSAIRLNCLACTNDQEGEVRKCPIKTCPLWPYRFGCSPSSALQRGLIKDEDIWRGEVSPTGCDFFRGPESSESNTTEGHVVEVSDDNR